MSERLLTAARGLDEPLAHAPLVLSEQDAAELREPVRRVVEIGFSSRSAVVPTRDPCESVSS